jgi:hypothetical protein
MSAVAEHLWACPVCHARWEQHQLPAEFPGPGCPVESAYCHLVAAPGRSVAVRANYSVVSVDGVIRVRDLDLGEPSVTNDAAAVVEAIVAEGFAVDREPIIYRDSTGQWDELVLDAERRFQEFRPLAVPFEDAAAVLARTRFARG